MKSLHFDMSQYNVNGVLHIGAGTGEFAKYYHELGVNKVLWIEQHGHKYGSLYSNTCAFGMDQKILTAQCMDVDTPPHVKKMVTLWRENAAYLDIDTYDVLHVASSKCRIQIIEGCDFLIDGFKEIIFSGAEDEDREALGMFMEKKGFVLSTWASHDGSEEFLFVRK